ncbi:Gfo/Idh/MocA family oxidoreductase [Rubellicoccus peritrichatus]|uniref:Gfo/Idh/MocA family oxidoreductase n=1 Tax=Rubellicoccus peritrichatus TaxID=3080537 RepID=A0AAQ3L9T3_9BACT|nr:Gfo/Idh/MocA family oxidoreductase [Puniceicoccus sp. CR14]WOO39970.1 Gfo/Idh/MocA family oxidoreductase [Puniceicoccus sp. CR14]
MNKVSFPSKTPDQSSQLSRRRFLKTSTALGAFSFLPSSYVFGQNSSGGDPAPSGRVNLAMVGIGHQGNGVRKSLLNSGLCNVVALCDVDLQAEHAQEAIASHPNAKQFTDFRVMFDTMADEIDAVAIAIPDHAHFSVTMLAMSLGKHVFVEKPLAHTFGQCERLIDLAERSGVVTQMGNQGHSGANYFQFKAWFEAGVIKDVTRITAHMNNWRRWHGWGTECTGFPSEPMPEGINWDAWINDGAINPYSKRLHPQNWRSWFDYGSGAFGDWGPHILDTAHRFLKLGLPNRVTAVKLDGPNPYVFPQASTIRFDFPEREGMPACEVTWYDGQKNKPGIETEYGELVTNPETGATARESVNVDKPGKVIYSEDLVFQGGSHHSPLRIIPKEKFMDMRKSLPKFPQKNSNHYKNFLLACKGEEESRSPFSVSGPLTQVFNIGILSQRFGGVLEFDRESKKITNNKTANAFLDPAPRRGWEEFYKL